MKRTTIHDVAEAAGVSLQTVSRVINNRPDVALETRQRVLETIDTLGYQPSEVARSLATQRTNLLGLVTIDYEDYFYAGVSSGVQGEAHQNGYMLVITSIERDLRLEMGYVQRLRAQRVDGLIIIRDTIMLSEFPAGSGLPDIEMPVVLACMKFPEDKVPFVDIDNQDGARQVGEHFLKYGHHRFAMITAPSKYQVSLERSKGFLAAIESAGITIDPRLVVEGDWHIQGGYQAARQLLSGGHGFTALFVHNDNMAIGAIQALREAGLRVPEDVSVAGFDDLPISAHLDPPLTSVWQPRHELGATLVRLLLDQINQAKKDQPENIHLKPRLIPRATVQISSS
jgi:LacI family repressor for deo operon, udp, cdd, tsx, nupC, and nupG